MRSENQIKLALLFLFFVFIWGAVEQKIMAIGLTNFFVVLVLIIIGVTSAIYLLRSLVRKLDRWATIQTDELERKRLADHNEQFFQERRSRQTCDLKNDKNK